MTVPDTCADASSSAERCEGEVLSRAGTYLCTHHDKRRKDIVNSHVSVDSGDAGALGGEAGQDGLDLGSFNPGISRSASRTLIPWKTDTMVDSADVAPSGHSHSRVISVGSRHSCDGPKIEETPAADHGMSGLGLELLTTLAVGGSDNCALAYPESVSGTSEANQPVLGPAPENSGRDDEPELGQQGQE